MTAASQKVLVIDDEPPIRKLLRMGLSTQGYDILEAATGQCNRADVGYLADATAPGDHHPGHRLVEPTGDLGHRAAVDLVQERAAFGGCG